MHYDPLVFVVVVVIAVVGGGGGGLVVDAHFLFKIKILEIINFNSKKALISFTPLTCKRKNFLLKNLH